MKRRYPIAFACLTLVAVLAFFNQAFAANIVDSYSESHQNKSVGINSGSNTGWGQSFTGDGSTLGSVVFYMSKTGSPSYNVTAKIYAHSGTFGTSGIPTGTALATSDNFAVSTLTTSLVLTTFTFSGANQITLTNGTKYVVTFENSNAGISSTPNIGYDDASPSHAGNASSLIGATWTASSIRDTIFYVYDNTLPPSQGPTIPTTYKQLGGKFIATGGRMIIK